MTLMAAVLTLAAGVVAQNAQTPYSMYGYGILSDRATSMQRQMGGVGVAMNNGRQINAMNPASYAAIDSLTFLFDLGADATVLWSKEGDNKSTTWGGGLDYATMQFPLGKYMGGSVGLLPYSSVGYAFGSDITHGTMENQGSGGINELYVGVAGKFKGFSLGVNVSYDFGNIVNDVFSTPTGLGRTKFEHVLWVRDWNILIGAQYTYKPTKNDKVVAGLTYSPRKTLLGHTWATMQETSQDTYPDTVAYGKLKNKYFLPHSVNAGVNYTHERVGRISVEFDFLWQGWKDAAYSALYSKDKPGDVIFEGMHFNNRTRFGLGAEYVHRLRGTYAQRIVYRLGTYYANDYLRIRGNNVKEWGVAAGIGLPTPEGKTVINIGLDWKRRTSTPVQLIGENYLSLSLGVNFNEVWFFKRKIK